MKRLTTIHILSIVCAFATIARAQNSLDSQFRNPPQEARPLMIWQWMDGVVSREGITADLEAYSDAGLGGVQQFLIGGPGQGLICDTTNAIGTPQWKSLMAHAMKECWRLGLSFGTHNCPGWSSSAFPAVEPQYSMQKLVWRCLPLTSFGENRERINMPERPDVDPKWNYYEDIAILYVPDDSIVRLDDIRVFQPSDFPLAFSLKNGSLVRIGHTTNGRTNDGTAPYGGVGLECDKMSRETVRRYWQTYPQMVLDIAHEALGSDIGATFQRMEIDSYEAGGQEWTRGFAQEFQQRRGYDPLPWLAVITQGIVIDSPERTTQFRKDYAATGQELFAENYYGYMAELCHQTAGMRLLYQPYGTSGSKPFNPLDIWKISSRLKQDIFCTEFWNKPDNWGWPQVPHHMDVAHRQGLREVYAEAFTCWPLHAWKDDPASIKQIADRAFCMGVNRLMLHAGAQNPWPQAVPGMTFGMWGTQFTPGQTWWRSGGARLLFDYFARCQALLQQGDYVDDYRSKNPSVSASGLQWTHRRTSDAEIYFISNPNDSIADATITLPITRMKPELWHPDIGKMTEAEAWLMDNDKTSISLRMEGHETLFIVLRQQTDEAGPGLHLREPALKGQTPITGTWTLHFPDGWGAPSVIILDSLVAWNEHADEGVKYFSGTARYAITFRQKSIDHHSRYVLDLGTVYNLARVMVNGREVAHLWKPPFRCDVTDALHKGKNTLEIEVTNLWPNRMIGDEQYEDDVEWGEPLHYEYASDNPMVGRFMARIPDWLRIGHPRPSVERKIVMSFKFFDKNSPLLPSGLLGPVRIDTEQ